MPPKKRRQKVGAVNYQKRKAISGVRADEDGLGRRDVVVEGGVGSGETMVQGGVGSGVHFHYVWKLSALSCTFCFGS